MSLDTAATGGAADAAPIATTVTSTVPSDGPLSIRQAAAALSERRTTERQATPSLAFRDGIEHEIPKTPAQRAPDGKFARAAEESTPPVGDDTAPPLGEPSGDETPVEVEPEAAELPPIDPPASWTKDEKDRFKALPRETQEYLAERERARDVEIRRGQNEAAEQRKAAEAERKQAEQARQQYENALPTLLQQLQAQAMGEFADIKSHDDVRKLAEEDPFRFAKFQAAQMHVAQVSQEAKAAQERQQKDETDRFSKWSADEDKAFIEKAPEFANPEKAKVARQEIVSYLTEVRGVPQDSLGSLWSNPVFRDHRMQLIVRDAAKWHAAQKKASAAVTKPVPPVQRPGSAPAKGATQAQTIAGLEAKLSSAKGVNAQVAIAAELRRARRAAA